MPLFLLQSSSPSGGDWAVFAVLIVLALIVFGLWVWSIVWAYRDAERRGKSGLLVALLVAFLSWPLGLLAWVIFRPEAPQGPARR